MARVLKTPSTRRALVVGCLLQLFQQLAGINTVMYYSAKIITMAGVSSKTLAIWLSAAVASMNFLWTIPGLILVEKIGRRKLLLASLFGMLIVELLHVFIISTMMINWCQLHSGVTLSLLVLGVGFQVANIDTPQVKWHPLQNSCDKYKDCGSCTYDRLFFCALPKKLRPKNSAFRKNSDPKTRKN